MRDAINQELQAGDLIAIIGGYRSDTSAGIVTGETKGGKIKFVYPYQVFEFRDWDRTRRINVVCKECDAQDHPHCIGHVLPWATSNSNKVNTKVIKITPEQLRNHVIAFVDENNEQEVADAEEFVERILEMLNQR